MRVIWMLLLLLGTALPLQARDLVFATVERPPFSFAQDGDVTGFSADLMRAIGAEIGATVRFEMTRDFSEMLGAVEDGRVDGAVANISITGEREAVMDFSLPIFRSGLQIMVPADDGPAPLWSAILTPELGFALVSALALLLALGMVMWLVEQRRLGEAGGDAIFPAFWYALTLVMSGGSPRDAPRTALGRLFGVMLVISSLFILSFLIANITTAMTLRALGTQVQSVDDLDGRQVATTAGSTASAFLRGRDISHETFTDYTTLLYAFEDGELDAVFFDSPLLAYYVANDGRGTARLVERVFRPEDYGIALPQGSDLRERVNVALLNLQESGVYEELYWKWFETGQ
ncbi:MAG: transporter substrate-binding domain-containing protein [Pseudomonadota bacterium]